MLTRTLRPRLPSRAIGAVGSRLERFTSRPIVDPLPPDEPQPPPQLEPSMLPFVRNPEALPLPPEAYFVDAANRSAPLVIEHATGCPAFAVIEGQLVPYDRWRAEHQRPSPGAPRGMTIASADGAFSAGLSVS